MAEDKSKTESTKTVAQKQTDTAQSVQRPFVVDELKRVKNQGDSSRATKLGSTDKQS